VIFAMTHFGVDTQPDVSDVSSVSAPTGGVIGLSTANSADPSLEHEKVSTWDSPPSGGKWNSSYTSGDVYYNRDNGDVTITMPTHTTAFYLFAEPDYGTDTMDVTATIAGGSKTLKVTQTIDDGLFGPGAKGYAFWTTGGDMISSITIQNQPGVLSSSDYAVGEFGISAGALAVAVPEPSNLILAGLGALGLIGYALRRKQIV
jgi:hypothetical protein